MHLVFDIIAVRRTRAPNTMEKSRILNQPRWGFMSPKQPRRKGGSRRAGGGQTLQTRRQVDIILDFLFIASNFVAGGLVIALDLILHSSVDRSIR